MSGFCVSLFVIAFCFVGLAGCSQEKQTATSEQNDDLKSGDETPVSHLAEARRKLQTRAYDAAADSAAKALLQDPDNSDARLVASEIEVARGNYQVAIDLADSIPIESRLGPQAVTLRVKALRRLGRHDNAADLLMLALRRHPGQETWRHQCWQLLNRVGRREEARDRAREFWVVSSGGGRAVAHLHPPSPRHFLPTCWEAIGSFDGHYSCCARSQANTTNVGIA